MFRALWTAASGMNAQQLNIDNISNNLANVNTTGFKKSTMEFQDLLYANMRGVDTTSSNGTVLPVPIQLGTGVKLAGTKLDFSVGNLEQTSNTFDLAMTGDAFFEITMADGTLAYTKDGSFQVNSLGQLVTLDGNKVNIQQTSTDPISFTKMEDVSVAANGAITMPTDTQVAPDFYTVANPGELVEDPTGFYTDPNSTASITQWDSSTDSTAHMPEDPYYKVEMPDGTEAYVRAGTFTVDANGNLVTTQTAPDSEGVLKPATLSTSTLPTFGKNVTQVTVNADGKFQILQEVGRLSMATFTNPQGLEKIGTNLYLPSAASGAARSVSSNTDCLVSGYLESSNVQLAEEMVKMIVAQRAYEVNSKAITTSDEMMEMANNLKR